MGTVLILNIRYLKPLSYTKNIFLFQFDMTKYGGVLFVCALVIFFVLIFSPVFLIVSTVRIYSSAISPFNVFRAVTIQASIKIIEVFCVRGTQIYTIQFLYHRYHRAAKRNVIILTKYLNCV